MKPIRVGYSDTSYTVARNINRTVSELEYQFVGDLCSMLKNSAQYSKIGKPVYQILKKSFPVFMVDWLADSRFRFKDLNLNKTLHHIDLLHLTNKVSYGSIPWVTTFETVIPRYKCLLSCHWGCSPDYSCAAQDPRIIKAVNLLAGKSCKRIISMSQSGLRIQKELLRQFPEQAESISEKMCVLFPPQESVVENFEAKKLALDGPLSFMFVGNAFFRKGGMEILQAFQRLRAEFGPQLELTIVSSLLIDPYAAHEGEQQLREAKRIIAENSDWIHHYSHIDNSEVINLMKGAHIGLLPTYADTFGYSVLEFQAVGCPVISTNVRALPEINNDQVGWLIDVPCNVLSEALYVTPEQRIRLSAAIASGLYQIIAQILNDRGQIPSRSSRAAARIRQQHSPARYDNILKSIYLDALGISS